MSDKLSSKESIETLKKFHKNSYIHCDYDLFTKEEIYYLIELGEITKEDVIDFYGNPQWDDEV